MTSRPIVLRNREINQRNEKADKSVYCGITTRKRAALMALENKNNNKDQDRCNKNVDKDKDPIKLKNNEPKISLAPLNVENEPEPMDISISKDENDVLNYDYLMKNPLVWPLHTELNNERNKNELLNQLIERRKAIRTHFEDLSNHGTPIWYLNRFNNHDEYMNIEYLSNINDYMVENEFNYEILGRNFLGDNTGITSRHRYVFVDWLVKAHGEFPMCGEVLQLSVAIFDRFVKIHKLSLKVDDLMIIGLMCMFIAAKVEEVWPPALSDLINHFKVDYSMDFCRRLESKIARTVGYKLSIPLPISFVRHYNNVIDGSNLSNYLSRYFCELSLQDYEASGQSVNLIGASCVFLAQVICQNTSSNFEDVWNAKLQASSGLLFSDIKNLVRNLCIVVSKQQTPSNHRAISAKYTSERFLNVSGTCISSQGFRNILSFFKSEAKQQK